MKDRLLQILDAVSQDQTLATAARKAAVLLRATPVVEIGQSRQEVAAADLARDYALRLALFRERGIERPGLSETAATLAESDGSVQIVYVDCELGSLTLLIHGETERLVGCTFG